MPRRLYAERRLLHPAVAQRAAVGRKTWTRTTKPARSEESLPAISIRAKYSICAKYVVERHRAAAWPRQRFDGNPIFCSLLVVADRRRQLDRGAGPIEPFHGQRDQ